MRHQEFEIARNKGRRWPSCCWTSMTSKSSTTLRSPGRRQRAAAYRRERSSSVAPWRSVRAHWR
jgi:hypothetical protein